MKRKSKNRDRFREYTKREMREKLEVDRKIAQRVRNQDRDSIENEEVSFQVERQRERLVETSSIYIYS